MEFYFFTDAGEEMLKQYDCTSTHGLLIERFDVSDLSKSFLKHVLCLPGTGGSLDMHKLVRSSLFVLACDSY